jgi:inosine-uridine nucleoside N-ribohydrolase
MVHRMTKKIIIDTDPGIDDAMAILFAFASPELEVVGLTSIFGNVHTPLATQNALRLVELAGRPHVPVAHGADKPLVIAYDEAPTIVHGSDGFGNTHQPPPHGHAIDRSAAQFIVEMVMAQPGEITLVPVGPLTNLALALELEPRIIQHVAEVVLMGGAATVNGNVNPAAEANIWHDPHAADRVFTAGWPLTMVGLDVTMATQMDEAYLAGLRGATFGDFIFRVSRFYLQFHKLAHNIDACHTHDPSAIGYLIDPTLFRTMRGPIRVVTEGIAAGQTLMDRRREWLAPTEWSDVPETTVCVEVDSARLLALYRQRITSYTSL